MTALVGPFAQDCGCRCHVGPHWLHMDEADRERTRRLVAQLGADPVDSAAARDHFHALVHCIATYEVERLRSKRREMARSGIDHIPEAVTEEIGAFRERYRAETRSEWEGRRRREIAATQDALTALATEYDSTDSADRKAALREEVTAKQARIAEIKTELDEGRLS